MMKLAIYTKDGSLLSQERFVAFEKALRASGNDVYRISSGEDLAPETEMILSVGGDGTFLSAAKRAGGSGIPVLGVNFGRLGFVVQDADGPREDKRRVARHDLPEGFAVSVRQYLFYELSVCHLRTRFCLYDPQTVGLLHVGRKKMRVGWLKPRDVA